MSVILAIYAVEGVLLVMFDESEGVVFFYAIFVPRVLIRVTSPILCVNLHGCGRFCRGIFHSRCALVRQRRCTL